jgi:DNA replication and repair protein RecF
MLTRYYLKSYRNLAELNLSLEPNQPIVLYGENNQGKTNFLESIYALFNGVSPIHSDRKELIHVNQTECIVGGAFQLSPTESQPSVTSHQLYLKLNANNQRFITLDGQPVHSITTLKKRVKCDFISADVIRDFQDSPDSRRRLLDGWCSGFTRGYSQTLTRYTQILRQKNKALKSGAAACLIKTLNQQLSEYGSLVVKHRCHFISEFTPILESMLSQFLSVPVSEVKIQYVHKSPFQGELTAYQSWLFTQLNDQLHKEQILGYSLSGPHRDDFAIRINQNPLFSFYSRGINRIVAIVSHLAKIQLNDGFLNRMLLLDDVFSEIDSTHKSRLIKGIQDHVQVVYASVLKSDQTFFNSPLVREVDSGVLR